MSGYRLSAPAGAWIDRARPLNFQFNGRAVPAFAGDTLASALLAHGIQHTGRSFKLHRPRGIFSCGVEEPSGLLDIGTGSRRTPNSRATEVAAVQDLVTATGNAWPSLGFDLASVNDHLAAVLPAGFYYKTFMWPHWKLFEPTIRRLAGLGTAPLGADPERYDEASVQVDVLVIGGGAAGLHAALAAARSGHGVMLLEGDPALGGWLATQLQEHLAPLIAELGQAGVQVLTRTTAFGLYDHQLVTAVQDAEPDHPHDPVRERLWKIRARQIVLATGAFERPMLFPDNDRPGVMLSDAVARYASHFGVACGRRVVLAAACDSAYRVAQTLQTAGIEVCAVVDRREASKIGAPVPAGVPCLPGSAIVQVKGQRGVSGVRIAGRSDKTLDVDLIASAGGFTPNVNLYSQAGGSLHWQPTMSMFVPRGGLPGVAVVGACAGLFDLNQALAHADETGRLAPGTTQPPWTPGGTGHVPADTRPDPTWLPSRPGKVFVDLQNDVSADDVALAVRENYRSVEHLKRYTTTGMATDQGKTSNVNALVLLGTATGREPSEVGTTKFRPPYTPVTLGALAGGRLHARQRPLRPLVAKRWHAARGALFEEFGNWQRPAAYPQAHEGLQRAAEREAAQVRQGVGLFDASPLGKIEVYGPDAADFLDLMYVGTLSTLPVGSARYGALLNENGIVVDDGIVARLGPDHFWVNTTSGGAERTARAFEEWLQCEYIHHRVIVMPVTSQWANVTVSGPLAWQLLARAGFDGALAPSEMRHMSVRNVSWRDHTLRVLRASFSGELGYELNLPSSQCEALLNELWTVGSDLGVCAYGVEALMTLRLEKGYLHIGVDTDGTTLPQDVGLARGISKKAANFVGRRSLLRPAAQDVDRLQLVGLLPVDRRTRVPVGAHLSKRPPPTLAEGHVTSTGYSAALGHPIAMGRLKGGTRRVGERLSAWHQGVPTEVEVVTMPFYDPEGHRIHG
jgi:sarcosine oxidase, subunit alpha